MNTDDIVKHFSMNKTITRILQGNADNHMLPFFWQHGEDEATLRKYMDVIQKANCHAVCVESRPHPDFCGEKWWQDLLGEISVFCQNKGVSKADVPAICKAFKENVVEYEYEVYSDAKSVLHYFKEKDFGNYVISNNFPELGEVFKRLGLDEDIEGYFPSASVGYEKPRQEIYAYAVSHAGNPEVRYMIGDNPVTDYQGGLDAGMTPILVHNKVDGLRCCGQLSELVDVIK